MKTTQRKVALITGGSRGIGLGIAHCMAQAGYDLAINGMRDEAEVAEALGQLSSHNVNVIYCQGNVAQDEDRKAIIEKMRDRMGRLDALINNAGVAPQSRDDILQASEESFDRVMTVNLKGPYFLTQQVARWMIEQKQADVSYAGTIVNVSSISSVVASVNRGEYCLSKAAISMATQLWAVRLAEFGIGVYEVRPGIIATDMTASPQVRAKYDAMLASGLTLQPRWGEPEDIGRAVTLLATGQLSYATGQVLTIDGGLTVSRL